MSFFFFFACYLKGFLSFDSGAFAHTAKLIRLSIQTSPAYIFPLVITLGTGNHSVWHYMPQGGALLERLYSSWRGFTLYALRCQQGFAPAGYLGIGWASYLDSSIRLLRSHHISALWYIKLQNLEISSFFVNVMKDTLFLSVIFRPFVTIPWLQRYW